MKSLSLIFLLLLSGLVYAQDLVQHGPDEVYYAREIVEGKDGRLFLSSTSGIYYSDNRGASWTSQGHYVNSIYAEPHFAIHPVSQDLYVGTAQSIYKSADNGETWDPIFLEFPGNGAQIRTLAVSGDTLWVGTTLGLLYFYGNDFVRVYHDVSNMTGKLITDVEVKGKTIIASTMGDGLFRTTNGGTSWASFNNGLPAGYEVYGIDFSASPALVFGIQGMFSSTDKGATWQSFTNGMSTAQVTSVARAGSVMYATTMSDDNVWKLPAAATTWVKYDEGMPDNGATMEFAWTDNTQLIVGGWRGIYKRNTSSGIFQPAFTGVLDAFTIKNLDAASDGTIWATASHTGVYSLADGATKFQPFVNNTANYGSMPMLHDSVVIVRDYALDFYDGVTKQFKGSMVYNNIAFPQTYIKAWGSVFISSQKDGIYRYNGAPAWETFNTGLTNTNVRGFVFHEQQLWAATDAGLFKRAKGDTEWTAVNFAATGSPGVETLYADDEFMLVSAKDYRNYISGDDGATWDRVADLDDHLVHAFLIHEKRIYAATNPGLFVSNPELTEWTSYQLPADVVYSLLVNDGRLYMGTIERGIWSIPTYRLYREPQQIDISNMPTLTAVGTTITLNATATSGLPVTYRLLSGPATLSGNSLTINDEGRIIIEVRQEGNEMYQPVSRELIFDIQNVTAIGEPIELVEIYPNPTTGWVHVKDATNKNVRLGLLDLQGRQLMSTEFTGETTVDMSTLNQGLYVMVMEREGRTVRRKVVRK